MGSIHIKKNNNNARFGRVTNVKLQRTREWGGDFLCHPPFLNLLNWSPYKKGQDEIVTPPSKEITNPLFLLEMYA